MPLEIPKGVSHGTYSGYTSGCRCRECAEAARAYHALYSQRPIEEKKLTHGKTSTYNAGCRCKECRAANRRRGKGKAR